MRPERGTPWAAGAALLLCGGLVLSACSSSPDDGSADDASVAGQVRAATPYWVDPRDAADAQAEVYRAQGEKRKAELAEMIARQPVAEWIGARRPGKTTRTVTRAARKAGREALLVLYNLPHRDCGQYSQGGARDGAAYRAWLAKVVRGIGNRAATVIVEPDALPHLLQEGCTPREFHEERYGLLEEAVTRLTALPRTTVYLDAGNSGWVRDPYQLVEPLERAGIGAADGFALNVSNYQSTPDSVAFGTRLSEMVGDKHFVVDTSRNGNGPAAGSAGESWCNPPGRALGERPTTRTGNDLVDAYLWIKRPGESDGTCKGGPAAGEWYPEYALELARNARGE